MLYYHVYDSYNDYLSNRDMINDRVNIEIIQYVSDGTSYKLMIIQPSIDHNYWLICQEN